MNTQRKWSKGLLLVLAIALAAAGWSYYQAQLIPQHYQRVFLPTVVQSVEENGETTVDNGLRDAHSAAEEATKSLEGACEKEALYAVAQPYSVLTADLKTAGARLVAMDESYYALRNLTLTCGRLIYPEEFKQGAHVALIDESLAVALYQFAQPLNMQLELDGEQYTIVGVLKAGKRVGDQVDHSLYAPYRALQNSQTIFTALIYEAIPIRNAGGWTSFQSFTKSLGEQGSTINLDKESMNAAMPQRLLVCVMGFALGFALIRRVMFHMKHSVRAYKDALRDTYAIKLLPRVIAVSLLYVLLYAACAALLVQLFVWLIEPVYTFPEWVPAVLVEPKDIQTAFWNVWQSDASIMSLRTPELLRTKFLRELGGWSSAAAGLAGLGACRRKAREIVQGDGDEDTKGTDVSK